MPASQDVNGKATQPLPISPKSKVHGRNNTFNADSGADSIIPILGSLFAHCTTPTHSQSQLLLCPLPSNPIDVFTFLRPPPPTPRPSRPTNERGARGQIASHPCRAPSDPGKSRTKKRANEKSGRGPNQNAISRDWWRWRGYWVKIGDTAGRMRRRIHLRDKISD